MGSYYVFVGSNLENSGKFWKNGRFSGRIWPDWENTAWADMVRLRSIGLSPYSTTNRIRVGFPTRGDRKQTT